MSSEVRRLVAAELPGARLESVAPLGAGLDHEAYLVDGDLVVRLGHGSEREARLLEAVAAICPVPVPLPLFATASALAYRCLPGVPLIELAQERRARHAVAIGRTLGDVLAALRGTTVDLADRDDTSLQHWRDEAAQRAANLAGEPSPEVRAHVEAFLAAPTPQPATDLVFSHNDLGIEHVLVDPDTGNVTGIIDWSDAAIADPARDLGLVLRDLGEEALDAAAPAAPDPALRERARFYARCLVLEDLAYGLETGRRAYVDKSRNALSRLFAR